LVWAFSRRAIWYGGAENDCGNNPKGFILTKLVRSSAFEFYLPSRRSSRIIDLTSFSGTTIANCVGKSLGYDRQLGTTASIGKEPIMPDAVKAI
jgi:hypothetical protein